MRGAFQPSPPRRRPWELRELLFDRMEQAEQDSGHCVVNFSSQRRLQSFYSIRLTNPHPAVFLHGLSSLL
jgi:hypothetical protein